MSIKKRYVALLVAIGVAIGWVTLGGSAAVMHYTSSTEFCLSCHSMEIPFKEFKALFTFPMRKAFAPNVPIAIFRAIPSVISSLRYERPKTSTTNL